MENASSIVFAGIAPHPPIMVPEVGHEAIAEVRDSIEAMALLTERLIASGAETVVLISPHAPLDPNAFVAYQGPNLYGDFANFRAPKTTVEALLDEELLWAIAEDAKHHNYEVFRIRSESMDHGTTVPLYFLQRNGWHGRVVALGYSFLSNDEHLGFGACVKRAVDKVGRPVAFLASGDLSHRLKPEAPAGYNPKAHLFDEEVVAALRANCPNRIIKVDQDLRKLAGECGYRSVLVALGATQDSPSSCEVLNYEAPFGVGYLVAQLLSAPSVVAEGPVQSERSALSDSSCPATKREKEIENIGADQLPALARQAVETFVLTDSQLKPPDNPEGILAEPAACFVSIKTRYGDLRGCIGTIEPTRETLAEELILNAINAASRDPRFPPVSAAELPQLGYSVDVLSAPEPAAFEELDPKIYGVIVEDEGGLHRGLLLPDIEGV
ncbi:MAG TPA: AmmeMemoRadiSam system protein A, partial [Pyrinomonadaceae bacterium]|nr:AmmeMemoRadiSam system protein A [Pyrinomonadaceae bacterium]